MIKILILLLILLPAEALPYDIIKTIDGDTVLITAPFLPAPLKPTISLRISGVDTPEKSFRAHCLLEQKKALDATDFTTHLIKQSKEKTVIIEKPDKYFRLLGDIILDGKSLRESLLENGYAKPYYGKKKPDWCKE